jgi:hypothetical protein
MPKETPISLEAVESLIAIKGQEEYAKAFSDYRKQLKYFWVCMALFIVGLGMVFLFTSFSGIIPWPALLVANFRYISIALEGFLLLILIYSVVCLVRSKNHLKEVSKKLDSLCNVTKITSGK